MFNRKKFKDDDFRDLERYEEYERRKKEKLAKATGNFLYRYFINGFIFIASYILISVFLNEVLDFELVMSGLIAIVSSLVMIFKIEYIKIYPFKSLIVIVFLNLIVNVAFYN